MPRCAGCSTFLLTNDKYCRACKQKIADGLLISQGEESESEEESARKKLVAQLLKQKEREEDDRDLETVQQWKVSGYVESMASQHWDGLKRLAHTQEIITKKEFNRYVLDDFRYRVSFLKFAIICNAKFFLLTNDTMVSVDRLGLNREKGLEVEKIVFPLVKETMPIRDLNCFTDLPRIMVSWTDWLVYSTLMKWSRKLDVGLSSTKTKLAVPLVAPRGQMDPETVDVSPRQRKYFVEDDLDNLDLLLESIIGWDDLE